MIVALLYYGVPALVIAVTGWVGFLGWRFYVREVVRGNGTDTDGDTDTGNAQSGGSR